MNKNKIFNSVEAGSGIGRTESQPTDVFVLTRKTHMPEMMFNNIVSKDLYWEIDQGEKWKLSQGPEHPSNECFLC